MGWFLTKKNFTFDKDRVKDWMKYPELVWLDRFDILVPLILAISLMSVGHVLFVYAPSLHTSGAQLLVWGFFISSIASLHATFSINSLAHRFGKRAYRTADNSKNNMLLAFLTFGEGWHNNHHYYPISAQQGFHWWQFDLTFYILCLMEKLHMITDLKRVPKHKLKQL